MAGSKWIFIHAQFMVNLIQGVSPKFQKVI